MNPWNPLHWLLLPFHLFDEWWLGRGTDKWWLETYGEPSPSSKARHARRQARRARRARLFIR